MFILLPTCDAYAPIASISLALLRRYWASHPIVHVLHHAIAPHIGVADRVELHHCGADESSWLGNVVRFLERQPDEWFLLMLDDYALCGPARCETISRAVRLMDADRGVGAFPLSWYPARERVARDGWPGVEALTGTPILLQAAIWRREAFLDLVRPMDPRTSPHGFERLATQRAKGRGIQICAAGMPPPTWVGGHFVDAFEKTHWPLPYHNLMHAGRLDPRHAGFLRDHGFDVPAQGLGDTVERIARATGMARLAKWAADAAGRDCGCRRRREALNRMVPYQR